MDQVILEACCHGTRIAERGRRTKPADRRVIVDEVCRAVAPLDRQVYPTTMLDILIRAPRAGDGDGLARCWLDAGAYYAAINPALFQVPQADGLGQWFEERLGAASDNRPMLVAEKDGQVAGYVLATIQHPSPAAPRNFLRKVGQVRAYVDILVVQDAYRRHGIGTRLMEAVEEWARDRGASVVLLDTYIGSDLSVPFYERRMGYNRRALRFSKTL